MLAAWLEEEKSAKFRLFGIWTDFFLGGVVFLDSTDSQHLILSKNPFANSAVEKKWKFAISYDATTILHGTNIEKEMYLRF